jgi:hypothetical protein
MVIQHMHAGRVRLSNGRYMTAAAFKETMEEQIPPLSKAVVITNPNDYDWPDMVDAVSRLTSDIAGINKRLTADESLRRASRDMASGALKGDKPTKRQTVTPSASEADLWN